MNSIRRHRSPATISNRHTIISLLILTVLCIIGIGVIKTQFIYNPAVTAIGAASQQSTEPFDTYTEPSVAGIFEVVPGSLRPLTAVEKFGPRNLSDKINGKAELYLSAGFKNLNSQRFTGIGTGDDWLELYVYDMGSHENAFAVFSAQQRDDAVTTDICGYGYHTSNAMFCVHGPSYLEVIGANSGPDTIASARRLIAAYVQDHPVKTKSLKTADLFPQTDLVADSIVMIAADAFGFEKLDHVYMAEYSIGGKTLTAFLSDRKSPLAAEEMAAAYEKFLLSFGGRRFESTGQSETVRIIEIFDTFENIFFTRGAYLSGVHEAPDSRTALIMTERLKQQLQQAGYGQ